MNSSCGPHLYRVSVCWCCCVCCFVFLQISIGYKTIWSLTVPYCLLPQQTPTNPTNTMLSNTSRKGGLVCVVVLHTSCILSCKIKNDAWASRMFASPFRKIIDVAIYNDPLVVRKAGHNLTSNHPSCCEWIPPRLCRTQCLAWDKHVDPFWLCFRVAMKRKAVSHAHDCLDQKRRKVSQ